MPAHLLDVSSPTRERALEFEGGRPLQADDAMRRLKDIVVMAILHPDS